MNDVNVPAGYKSIDIGVIPEDWQYITFRSILSIPLRNGIYKAKECHGQGVRVVNMGELFAFEKLPNIAMSRINLSEKEYEQSNVIEGDLLFARRSLVPEGSGKCTLVLQQNEPLTFESSIIRARLNYEIAFSGYLLYLFSSRIGKYLLRTILRQVAVSGITGSDLSNLQLPLPTLPEQKAIARVLSDVDELIRKCDSLLAKKRNIKQGTMQQLLTGKKRLPGFSGEWEKKIMSDVCSVNQGLQIAIEKRFKNHVSGSKKYITIQYLNNSKEIEYISNYSSSVCCTEEDILMTRTGNTGIVVSDVNGVFHNNFFKINFDRKILERKFLIEYLSSDKLQKTILVKAGTSTIPDLNHNDFYSIPINFPTLTEQKAISQILSDMDAEIEALEKKRDKYKAIKQGMMQELLTGKTRLIN